MRRRWRPGGRDHGGNASLFGAMPGPGSVEHKDWEGMMLSACTDAGIFELIGTNRKQKKKTDKGRAEE
ncbi:hypothetical protein INR49_006108 [Caranx melampygus]|nr:hypothetical protein INR49_006108 [Caranx melampygus]